MALFHVSHPPWLRPVGARTSYIHFSNISWTPQVLDPITIPSWGPPLGCTLFHPLSKNKKIKSLKKFTFCPMAYQAGCGPSYLAALTPCAPASHLLSALCPLKDLSPAAPSAQVASPLTHLLLGYLSFFEVHGNVSFLERPYLTAPLNMCLTFPLPSFSISVIFSL